jgi:hypothetical protein
LWAEEVGGSFYKSTGAFALKEMEQTTDFFGVFQWIKGRRGEWKKEIKRRKMIIKSNDTCH